MTGSSTFFMQWSFTSHGNDQRHILIAVMSGIHALFAHYQIAININCFEQIKLPPPFCFEFDRLLMVISLLHWLTMLNLIDLFLTIIAMVRSGSEYVSNISLLLWKDMWTVVICCIWVTLTVIKNWVQMQIHSSYLTNLSPKSPVRIFGHDLFLCSLFLMAQ